jgi:hypothetical protein
MYLGFVAAYVLALALAMPLTWLYRSPSIAAA